MTFPLASWTCCDCSCTSVAWIVVLDEADDEDASDHAAAMVSLCSRDEDLYHPIVPNTQTGLNYSTNPTGSTRIGLELFLRIVDQNPPADEGSVAPSDPTGCTVSPYSHELDHVLVSHSASGTNEYDAASDIITQIHARFGLTKPFEFSSSPPAGVNGNTYVNPHPQKIIAVLDDSGSHTFEQYLADTHQSLREHYLDAGLPSYQVSGKFSVVRCEGGTFNPFAFSDADAYETWTKALNHVMSDFYD